MAWTEEETCLISTHFPDKEKLSEVLPGKTWRAICAKHRYLYNSCDLSVLLNKSDQSFYYLGFLCAKGTFKDDEIKITLPPGCLSFFNQFQLFLKQPIKIESISETKRGRIVQMLQIIIKNTDHIPDITKMVRELPSKRSHFFAFLAGMIDWAGHIGLNINNRSSKLTKNYK